MLRDSSVNSSEENETAELRKKKCLTALGIHESQRIHGQLFPEAHIEKEEERKKGRLSVDIFHGKRELSRIHGYSARGKEAIKSARFDSYLGKDKNGLYFLGLLTSRADTRE